MLGVTEWRIIPGYDRYEASDDGRIRNAANKRERRMDGLPWWLGPFTSREARQALVSLRQSAEQIHAEARSPEVTREGEG